MAISWLRLQQIYGDRFGKIVLFGSQARGDAKPDSDIDVLIVLKGEVKPGEEIEKTGNIMANLSLQNDEVILEVLSLCMSAMLEIAKG